MREEKHGRDVNETAGANAPGGLSQNSLLIGMVALMVLVAGYNQYQIATLSSLSVPKEIVAVPVSAASGAGTFASQQAPGSGSVQRSATNPGVLLAADPRPAGTPAIYGAELGVNYDDVSEANPGLADQTIAKLSKYDREMSLEREQLNRYIKIGSSISCEYCCGAQSIIFSNGQPACGCAHSYAMRGLAKYLIKNHGSEYTDDQILEELGKWKVLFFPGVHAQKAAVLEKSGIQLNYINLASNKYRGAEKGSVSGSGGSMVGGC
ncbi:TPA: hypothetical protein HA225_02630 [Candidatus Micrarchaeota archaeon]|nr:hypothetical protein [Candidatus Micrarchaeota archaeon]HIH30168.1 hypothetical protein [Candidatus Micrarchaeota archaeon]